MLLISDLAMFLSNILGATGEALEYDLLLKTNTAKTSSPFPVSSGAHVVRLVCDHAGQVFRSLNQGFR